MSRHKKTGNKKQPDSKQERVKEKQPESKAERDKRIKDQIYFYKNLLKNSNIQAFLLTIRKGEGTLGDRGYYKHFGGGTLSTLDVNPEMGITWTAGIKHRLTESNVGAYQFQNKTKGHDWPNIVAHLDFNDISPIHQDIGALYIIDHKGAIPDILKGNIKSAINKTHGKWSSLPDSPYDQPKQKLEDALKFYEDHGGNLNGPGHIGANNLIEGQDLPKLTWRAFQYYTGIDTSSNITGSSIIRNAEKMQEWLALLKILEPGKIGKSTQKGSLHKQGKKKKKVGSIINLHDTNLLNNRMLADFPYKQNPWAVPEYLNGGYFSTLPTSLTDAGNLFSAVDTISNPGYAQSIYGVSEVNANETKPSRTTTTAGQFNKKQASKNGGIRSSGNTVIINLNRPMIENFTINVKDGRDGIEDFKHKVEGVLIEILNNANAIK